jgi:ketosteroid isomerase-like protein
MALEENKAVVQRLFDTINNSRLEELPQVVARRGRPVVARFTMSGTNTGDHRGLPAPTQQHFESEAIAILRIANGRVTELRGTADRLGMLTQLGILPDIG